MDRSEWVRVPADISDLCKEMQRLHEQWQSKMDEDTDTAEDANLAEAAREKFNWAAANYVERLVNTPPPAEQASGDDLAEQFRRGWEAGRADALSQRPVVDEAWRQKAAEWLESKAVEQEANNQRWPDHAAAYGAWRDRPVVLRILAAQVLAPQQPEKGATP